MRLFLDTSIQIDRVIGDQPSQEAVRNNCQDQVLVSSIMVFGEFVDTLIHDAVILHELVTDSPNVAEALRRLPKFRGLGFRPRRPLRMVAIYANLTEEGQAPREEVLSKLERIIDWQYRSRFHEDLSEVVNEIDCAKARWAAPRIGTLYDTSGLRCRKDSPPSCRIADFIEDHRGDLENVLRLLAQLRGQDKQLDDARQTIQKVLEGTDLPFGNNCRLLADAIITLEAPADAPIYTTNESHFRPLAAAIGKSLFTAR